MSVGGRGDCVSMDIVGGKYSLLRLLGATIIS